MAVSHALLIAGLVSLCGTARGQTRVASDAGQPSSDAAAAERAECASSFEQSQVLRQSGQLLAARKQLLKCAQLSCMTAVQSECTRWLAEVEQLTPTVVISATAGGQDRSYVHVEVDGVVLTEVLTGTAFPLDPGSHNFRFVHADYPAVERTVVLRVGDKLRPVEVAFHRPKAASVEPAVAAGVPPQSPPEPVALRRPVPALTYALTGVALVGGGAFAYLGLSAIERRNHLEHVCSPNCSSNDVDPVHSRLLAADISLGVGIAALTGALISYLARPSVPAEHEVSGNVNVTREGVRASAVLTF